MRKRRKRTKSNGKKKKKTQSRHLPNFIVDNNLSIIDDEYLLMNLYHL